MTLRYQKRFICGICGAATDDDPLYVELELVIDDDKPSKHQTLGAHAACLRAAFKKVDIYIAEIP